MFTITQVCVRENQRKPITNYINVQATELIGQELLDNMRIYYSFLSSFSIILSPESKLIPVFIIEIWFISEYPTLNSRFPLRSKEALQELIKYSKKKKIYIYTYVENFCFGEEKIENTLCFREKATYKSKRFDLLSEGVVHYRNVLLLKILIENNLDIYKWLIYL